MRYHEVYKESIDYSAQSWQKRVNQIDWYKVSNTILSKNQYNYQQWFEDSQLTLSYLCIDRHLKDGFESQNAVIYDSPVINIKQDITFDQLHHEVSKLAGGLKDLGLKKGGLFIIGMSIIPQAVFVMLACVRIKVIHLVVLVGFALHELTFGINDCKPKVIITASNGTKTEKIIPHKSFVNKVIAKAENKSKRKRLSHQKK